MGNIYLWNVSLRHEDSWLLMKNKNMYDAQWVNVGCRQWWGFIDASQNKPHWSRWNSDSVIHLLNFFPEQLRQRRRHTTATPSRAPSSFLEWPMTRMKNSNSTLKVTLSPSFCTNVYEARDASVMLTQIRLYGYDKRNRDLGRPFRLRIRMSLKSELNSTDIISNYYNQHCELVNLLTQTLKE